MWVGRFIDFKHPEVAIELAKKLKEKDHKFILNMVGVGELEDNIKRIISEYKLENNVRLLGSMTPDEVRKYMEESQIFIFTSDRGEGWGAVLNEAMNSACAVVASHEIGSVPFLIKNNENGLIYEDGNTDDLFNKVEYLLNNMKICAKIGHSAYETMINLWSPEIAARRFVELSKNLLEKKEFNKYNEGPCSKAERLKDNWYLKW